MRKEIMRKLKGTTSLRRIQALFRFYPLGIFTESSSVNVWQSPKYIPKDIRYRNCSVKKGILINLSNLTGKQLYYSLFLIKLQA